MLIVSMLVHCRSGSGNDLGIRRLIDSLDVGGVVSTPLADIQGFFPLTIQKCGAEEFRPVFVEDRKYWAVPTRAPLICPLDYDVPPDLSVSHNGEDIRTGAPAGDSWSWRWLRGETTVDFSKPGRRFGGFFPINPGQALQQTVILPPGIAVFELSARVADAAPYVGCLEVGINEEKREIRVGTDRVYRFVERLKLGENRIRIVLKKLESKGRSRKAANRAVFEVKNLRIKPQSDLVLISAPEGVENPSGDFVIRYVAEPCDRIIMVKKNLVSGENLTQAFDQKIPAGNEYELLYQPVSETGQVSFSLDGADVVRTDIKDREWNSLLHAGGKSRHPSAWSIGFTAKKRTAKADAPGIYVDSLIAKNNIKTRWLPIYQFKDFRIQAGGIGGNPYRVKKKLRVYDESLNSVFAVPPSVFKWRLRIPENGVMNFGYGILPGSWEEEREDVVFKIQAEVSGIRETLFEARLDPFHRVDDRNFNEKNIDLGRFQGKTVTLWFRTSAGEEDEIRNADGAGAAMAVWVNPFIYGKAGKAQRDDAPAHIILISLDTVGARHLGCYGYPRPTSPHLDELAGDGALFLNAFSGAPYTLASHMSLFTGLVPSHHQVFSLDQSLNPKIRTLTELLRSSGYHTAALTDGGLMGQNFGFAKGFDLYQQNEGGGGLADSAQALARKAFAYLDSHRDHKFFLFLHTYQAHNPYCSPAPQGGMFLKDSHPWKGIALEDICGPGFRQLFKEAGETEIENAVALYDGEIRYTDDVLIKPLIEKLKELDLYERSMIVVIGDHGEAFQEHGYWMHSWNIYNEVVQVPLVIKFPANRHRGRKIDDFVGLIDVVPTILQEADIRRPRFKIDGRSLVDLAAGIKRKPRPLMICQPENVTAAPTPRRIGLIRDPYKLIINDPYPKEAYRWFDPPPREHPRIELYNLRKDPGEKRNLADRETSTVQELMREARAYLKDLDLTKKGNLSIKDKKLEEQLRTLGYIE